ncbi:MAG: type VI secretion system Vgr family protein [Steroidobacteraceae bacterium]
MPTLLTIEVTAPEGVSALLFKSMRAHEEMSRLSEYRLELLSTDGGVNLDDVLGKVMTVKVALPQDGMRYFSGYVTRMAYEGMRGRYHGYSATLHPWLWFLTRTADCRIFQDLTVPDIVKKVFGDYGTADVDWQLTSTYRKWDYCVQYRETDFNFVSRLLEHEGIYYYFKHQDGRSTLVVTDSYSGHNSFDGYEKLPYVSPGSAVRPELEHVETWEVAREIQSGVFTHDDYDFTRPSVELLATKSLIRDHGEAGHKIYDFPGQYLQKADGDQYASVRIDELAGQFETFHGSTNARGACVGFLLTLEDHPRSDQNREYLLLSTSYHLEYAGYESGGGSGATCQCSFAAMSSHQSYRPPRLTPKPFVQGPQTAVVVGSSGEEIYTDEYGRVKVQFHWDRVGKKDENSSCWLRVSQPWAGKGWGSVAIPRIGQEVLVDFLEGDPDQPIVTGRVYNAVQMPPYALPTNMTQTGIKTRSSKGGNASNFNEIRFEDLKGSEQLFVHAEKNHDIEVENNETLTVGSDRTKKIGHDETTTVGNNRTETVTKNEGIRIGVNQTLTVVGNQSTSVGGNRVITVTKAAAESVLLAKALSIGLGYQVSVGAAMNESVAAAHVSEVGGYRSENVAGYKKTTVGKKLSMESTEEIELKTGDSQLSMKKDGTIQLTGKDVTIKTSSGTVHIKEDGTIEVSGTDTTMKTSSGTVHIDAGGIITIKGSMVKINS